MNKKENIDEGMNVPRLLLGTKVAGSTPPTLSPHERRCYDIFFQEVTLAIYDHTGEMFQVQADRYYSYKAHNHLAACVWRLARRLKGETLEPL